MSTGGFLQPGNPQCTSSQVVSSIHSLCPLQEGYCRCLETVIKEDSTGKQQTTIYLHALKELQKECLWTNYCLFSN